MDDSDRPLPPLRVADVPWEAWSEGIRFGGRVQRVGEQAGGRHIGVLIEELPPKKQSAPLHWHTREEEHIWFLAGRATLRLGDERHAVGAGTTCVSPPVGRLVIASSTKATRRAGIS